MYRTYSLDIQKDTCRIRRDGRCQFKLKLLRHIGLRDCSYVPGSVWSYLHSSCKSDVRLYKNIFIESNILPFTWEGVKANIIRVLIAHVSELVRTLAHGTWPILRMFIEPFTIYFSLCWKILKRNFPIVSCHQIMFFSHNRIDCYWVIRLED